MNLAKSCDITGWWSGLYDEATDCFKLPHKPWMRDNDWVTCLRNKEMIITYEEVFNTITVNIFPWMVVTHFSSVWGNWAKIGKLFQISFLVLEQNNKIVIWPVFQISTVASYHSLAMSADTMYCQKPYYDNVWKR